MAEEEVSRAWSGQTNGSPNDVSLDPRILRIAAAIGRQLARAQAKPLAAANDNELRQRSRRQERLPQDWAWPF
jgi:hypothetical protein